MPDGLAFEVGSHRHDSVLAQRGSGKPARPRDAAPRPLQVVHSMDDPTGKAFIPWLPTVLTNQDFDRAGNLKMGQAVFTKTRQERSRPIPEHVESLGAGDLSHMVCVAGDTAGDRGLRPTHAAALRRLFGRNLEAVASQCQEPQAVCNVALALRAEDSVLYLRADPIPGDSGRWGSVQANFDSVTVKSKLAGMEPGQHWYIRTSQSQSDDRGGHAMGIGIQRRQNGDFRISVFNSNSWNLAIWPREAPKPDGILHAYRMVDMEHALSAMTQLLDGPPLPAASSDKELWSSARAGRPLLEWLCYIGPSEHQPMMEIDRDANQRPIESPVQKGNDCAIEAQFAFMASALQPADYKLAKAACLNTLVQLADRLEPPGTAPANSPLQQARRRLQERITTSLSGHMVAPAPSAPGG